MEKKLISVIIPMYNASRFIKQCVKSILKQTYKNFELLIINDGSTDNSLDICSRFNDQRIKIINQKNAGCEYARLTGIKQSKGEYICFVDADDWIAKDYLEKLIVPAEKYDVDVVCINSYKTLDRYGLIRLKGQQNSFLKEGLLTIDALSDFYNIYVYNRVFTNNVWGKLYKATIIDVDSISPAGIFYGEDLLFNLRVTYNIKSCYLVNEYKYYYRYGGYTIAEYNKYWEDNIRLYYAIKEFALENHNRELQNIISYSLISIFHWMIIYLCKFLHQPKSGVRDFISSVLNSEIYAEMDITCNFNPMFLEAIQHKNIDAIMKVVESDVKSNILSYRHKIFRSLFKILN